MAATSISQVLALAPGEHRIVLRITAGAATAAMDPVVLSTVPPPILALGLNLPDRFIRPVWNPGRSYVTWVPQRPPPVAPLAGFRMLPELYPWPRWRSVLGSAKVGWATQTPPPPIVSYALSAPASVYASEPFSGLVAISNTTSAAVYVSSVAARTSDPDYAAYLTPASLVNFPGLSETGGQLYKTTGWFKVLPGETATLRFDAVLYAPGVVSLAADVRTTQSYTMAAKRITTLHTTPPALITVLAVGS